MACSRHDAVADLAFIDDVLAGCFEISEQLVLFLKLSFPGPTLTVVT